MTDLNNPNTPREETPIMTTTHTPVEAFGLGINDDDIAPFLGSDFHMPHGWTGEGPGSLPRRITLPAPFLVIGDGGILAETICVDVSERAHRWEHRPTLLDDGTLYRKDYGRGWVLDLDPNAWIDYSANPVPIVNHRISRSYEYGLWTPGVQFAQRTAADIAA